MNEVTSALLCPVMVNRKAELNELLQGFAAVEAGRPQAILIDGEPGIGKSRLCRALAESVAVSAAVVTFHAAPQDTHLPYGALTHGLRRVIRRLQTGTADVERLLEPCIPVLRALIPEVWHRSRDEAAEVAALELSGGASLDAEIRRRQIFAALVAALSALLEQERPQLEVTAPRVLLLCFEDIHWADDLTLDFLRYIVHSRVRPTLDDCSVHEGIMLVCTYRTEYLEMRPRLLDFVQSLSGQRIARKLTLGPLSQADHASLVAETLGHPVKADFGDFLYEHSDGNPFVTEELLGSLLAAGFLQQGESEQLPDPQLGIHLAPTLRVAVLERFSHLSPATQDIMRAASVIGREFDFDLLQRVTQSGEERILCALRDAVQCGLISECIPRGDFSSALHSPAAVDRQTGETFRFRHALTRDAVEADMLSRERRLLHRRIAEELVKSEHGEEVQVAEVTPATAGSPLAGRAALHFIQAGLPLLARPHALVAARWALSVGGWSEAGTYLEWALAATPPADDSRPEILAQLGRLCLHRQNLSRGLSHLIQARDESLARGMADRAALLGLDLACILWCAEPDRARTFVQDAALQAKARWDRQEPLDAEAVALYAGASLAAAIGHSPDDENDALVWCERARSAIDELGLRGTISDMHWLVLRGAAKVHLGRPEEAIPDLEQGLSAALESGNLEIATLAHSMLLASLHQAGKDDQALVQYRAALDFERGTGAVVVPPEAIYAFLAVGGWSQGVDEAKNRLALYERLDLPAARALTQAALGHLFLAMGQHEAAFKQFEAAWEHLKEISDLSLAAPCLWGLARADAASGNTDRAVDAFRRLKTWARTTTAGRIAVAILLDGCSFFADLEDPAEAAAWARELSDLARPTAMRVVLVAASEAAGTAALSASLLDEAVRCLRSGVQGWTDLCRPYESARCMTRLARALLSLPCGNSSRRAEIERLLSQAEATFARLGASADERIAGDLRRKSGFLSEARRRRATAGNGRNFGGLTARERDVLELLVNGSTNREIASTLFIAESTAELHVSRVLGKLGCTSRSQAAVHAVTQGWFAQTAPGVAVS